MLPVAVIEDSVNDAKRLQDVWREYCDLTNTDSALDIYPSAEEFLSQYHCQYDLIFIDIDLPGKSGLFASQKVREADESVPLIIVTQVAKYAIDGYTVNATDFILKPISVGILKEKMVRVNNIIERRKSMSINLMVKDNIIKTENLIYVEVSKHNIIYHTIDGNIVCRGALKNVETKLPPNVFTRLNYSFVVNMNYISSIDKLDCKLTNGETLFISRNRKKEFSYDFARFLGGSL